MNEATRQNTDAASLYRGTVMHARLKPLGHRFSYRVLNLLIDLDRLTEADRQSRLFGVNRRARYSFHERDHGPRDGSALSSYVRRLANAEGIDLADGRLLLLCYPRLFGYVFNPLSVYYCHAADGKLVLLIYEVRNTFGEMHTYICPVREGESGAAGVRQTRDKRFYVSPFIPMDMRYHFRMSAPGKDLKVRILETDRTGPLLAATFHGRRLDLTSPHLIAAFCALPFVTLKVILGIHYEALRLWLKGARLVPRPQPDDDPGSRNAASAAPLAARQKPG